MSLTSFYVAMALIESDGNPDAAIELLEDWVARTVVDCDFQAAERAIRDAEHHLELAAERASEDTP